MLLQVSAKDSDVEALITETNLLKESIAKQHEDAHASNKKLRQLSEEHMQLLEQVENCLKQPVYMFVRKIEYYKKYLYIIALSA